MRFLSTYILFMLTAPTSAYRPSFDKFFALDTDSQIPLDPTMPDKPQTLSQPGVLISDVMGRDRSINVFAGFARDVEAVASRLDDSSVNSTVLAPLNSAIDKLPGKPWEDQNDYNDFGATAYNGDDGQERARRNIKRFVQAHIVPTSPWKENERSRSLLDGDKEIWWEMKDGAMMLQPDGIEVQNIASKVGNGEVWIIKSVRNYT
ncbi:hypothetical protein F5B22DRAFT_651488 [Xylaria bambusicola]|uniref:uncharacterized protein n=1 Tax=Xylaria bambusicola TaxID=326684 RepID=UPI002008BEC9|nr:uncharacterized protein F5B22DRAFT_651488 [Xylaria bambusicola]KAI0505690.1 hypothetical protein F5B22DRAFT_651488 [Xylaria bambusicola]